MIVFYWLLFVLPLVRHPLWGAKVGFFTVFEYLGLASLLFAIVESVFTKKIPPVFGSWVTRGFLSLYLIALFSAMSEPEHLSYANQSFVNYTSTMGLFVITIALVNTLRRLRGCILVLIGSYTWASLYLIREWQHGMKEWTRFRAGWIVGDSNFFSTGAIVAIMLAFTCAQHRKPWTIRWYCLMCLFIALLGITVCASRGAFLGLVASTVVLAWRSRRRFLNFTALAALILGFSMAMPVSPIHRFLHPTISETGSEESHWDSWRAGYRMILEHPLVGIGLGRFKSEMPKYADPGVTEFHIAHNMFLEVAAELGLPAFIIFVAIFVGAYKELGALQKAVRVHWFIRSAASAFQAGLVGVVVSGLFVSAEYEKTTWTGIALISSLAPLARVYQKKVVLTNYSCRPSAQASFEPQSSI